MKHNPGQYDYVEIGESSALGEGERLSVEIDGQPIVLMRVGGKVYAIADICSHDGNPLGDGELAGHQIICPRHGARFDIRTGRACSLPAVVNIPIYQVREENGQIAVGLLSGT